MKIFTLAFAVCMGSFFTLSVIPDAEAKRMGGGSSFGSKPSQNQSVKRTDSNTAGKASPAQQQNADRKAAMAKKGGMMGILGGLMIGGLLGALFFGGAFENINFMDILLFGLIAFVLYKIFAMRRNAQQPTATANGAPINESYDNNQYRESVNEYGSGSATDATAEEQANYLQTGKIPRGFDRKSFLDGADKVYHILQNAWDKGELADIREFCTDKVFAEIQDQYRARSGDTRTEVISLKSELVNYVKSDSGIEVTVIFNAELKEYDNENQGEVGITKAQEAWYFLQPKGSTEHTWLLDAIQQVED